RYGFADRSAAIGTGGSSRDTRIADARVVASAGRYFRLTRNVNSPACASSIPATPVISSAASPCASQPSFLAISPSFMVALLASTAEPLYKRRGKTEKGRRKREDGSGS